jgi:hypothetical protein
MYKNFQVPEFPENFPRAKNSQIVMKIVLHKSNFTEAIAEFVSLALIKTLLYCNSVISSIEKHASPPFYELIHPFQRNFHDLYFR